MKTLALLALAFALPVFGQDCNSTIVDNAHVFQTRTPLVLAAAQRLNARGADTRVITDDDTNTPPDLYVDALRRQCPSWQSMSGGVKNNLAVFLVFPAHHKLGAYFGSEYGGFVHGDVIRTQYMAPSFRDKDWALGMIKAMDQAGIQITAHQEAALHPAVVTQQATDMHGLWVVMGWIVGLAALGGLVWLYFYLVRRRSAARDAQQAAVNARNDTAKWLSEMSDWLTTKEALNVDVKDRRAAMDAASRDFAQVSSSETYNPDTKGLSADQYDNIARRYQSIKVPVAGVSFPSTSYPQSHKSYRVRGKGAVSSGQRFQGNPSVDNSSFVYAPVTVIDESPGFSPSPNYEPHYAAPEPSSWSSDSGSSSYDSGSSSFSSDSSSSDFSSDSGGGDSGGSSDF